MRWLTTGNGKLRVIRERTAYIGCPVKRGSWRLPASSWANRFETRDGTRKEVTEKYRV